MLNDRYDLYLVGHKIADYSGIDLLKEAVASNCVRPIIILTSKGEKKIDEEALEAGAADYLTKDQINSETLERAIRYAFKQFETLRTLKQSEHTFRTLFERSIDAIVITDISGNIMDVNKSALDFFGLEYSDISEINCAFFYRLPKERQSFIELLQRDGAINDTLVELMNLDGDVKTCCVTAFTVIPHHGDSELIYTFIRELPESPNFSLSHKVHEPDYDLRTQLPQSVRAVRVSLSKIARAVENRTDLEICDVGDHLLDTIRMNASFADQALKSLEDRLHRA